MDWHFALNNLSLLSIRRRSHVTLPYIDTFDNNAQFFRKKLKNSTFFAFVILWTLESLAAVFQQLRLPIKGVEMTWPPLHEEEVTDPLAPKTTYNKISLEQDYLRYIGEKADSCMQENQPFICPDFNMTRFSVLTNIPVHHLAYYFSKTKKQTFGDYRNQWRIDHAKKLITEGKAALETLGVAEECSRSGEYDIVICYEINNAVHDGLLKKSDLSGLIKKRNKNTSLCLTGRNFPEDLIKLTDIATEMTKLKHHFDDKFLANKGIDY